MEAIARRVLSCVVVQSRSWSPYTEERCSLLLSIFCVKALLLGFGNSVPVNLGNLTF